MTLLELEQGLEDTQTASSQPTFTNLTYLKTFSRACVTAYRLSKKKLPNLHCQLLYEIGNYFLDMQ